MNDFHEAMQANPPRLVVQFGRQPDGSESFMWGIVGAIPLMSLVGAVVKIQHDLCSGDTYIPEMEGNPPALVIEWGDQEREFRFWKHIEIPTDPLVGMLDTIRFQLCNSRMGQHAAAQRVALPQPQTKQPPHILGPDGHPMK